MSELDFIVYAVVLAFLAVAIFHLVLRHYIGRRAGKKVRANG